MDLEKAPHGGCRVHVTAAREEEGRALMYLRDLERECPNPYSFSYAAKAIVDSKLVWVGAVACLALVVSGKEWAW